MKTIEKKELHLGKMTGQELAEWFGVKHTTYKQHKKKYLDKLEMFCKFEPKYGYIEIEEIFVKAYDKKLNTKIESIYLKEVLENPLSSVTGISEKYDITVYQATKARNHMFGDKPRDLLSDDDNKREIREGIAGFRENTWAIKLPGINNYRGFTREEEELLDGLIVRTYGDTPASKVKAQALLLDYCVANKMSAEQYRKILQNKDYDFFSSVIEQFKVLTGHLIVRVNRYEVHFYKTEQEYYNSLLTSEEQQKYITILE